jgi:hypothetical protein
MFSSLLRGDGMCGRLAGDKGIANAPRTKNREPHENIEPRQ